MRQEYLGSSQAAAYLEISRHQIYKLSAAGKITTYSPTGGKIYFLKSDLDEWVISGKKATANDIQSKVNKSFLKGKRP